MRARAHKTLDKSAFQGGTSRPERHQGTMGREIGCRGRSELLRARRSRSCSPRRYADAQVLFWSTQAKPVEETQRMRDQVLAGFEGGVDYQPSDDGPWLTRIQAELEAGTRARSGVLGALHGSFASMPDDLVDLSGVDLGGQTVNEAYLELGTLGTAEQKYLPWMQATYIMAANKKALEFLPEGADINALTYDQLVAWSKALAEATGSPKFGFPAGPEGLKHRFFQGFLLPSYAQSMVTKFRSAEAEAGWNMFKELWQYTNPASTGYAFMQQPLLTEEVWIAFDHVARLADAFNQKPDDFVAFPAPGRSGRPRLHAGGRRDRRSRAPPPTWRRRRRWSPT